MNPTSLTTDSTAPASATSWTLRDTLAAILRSLPIVIVFVLVGAASGAVYVALATPAYEAESSVLVNRQNLANTVTRVANPDAQPNEGPRVLETQSAVALSPAVAENALKSLGITDMTPQELLDETTVTPDDASDILHFTVEDEFEERSMQLANAYAQSYIDVSTGLRTARVREALRDINGALSGAPASVANDSLELNREQLRTIIALNEPSGTVTSRADSADLVKPDKKIVYGLAVFLGLLVGVIAAVARHSLGGSFTNDEELTNELGATIHVNVESDSGEAGRHLRAVFDGRGDLARSGGVLIAAVDNEQTSAIAEELARAFAESGRTTLLIKASTGVTETVGVGDVITGGAQLDQALISDARGFAVSSFGTTTAEPSDIFGSGAFQRLIGVLRNRFEMIVIECPPVTSSSIALATSQAVDMSLIVVDRSRAKRRQIEEAGERFGSSPAEAIAVFV